MLRLVLGKFRVDEFCMRERRFVAVFVFIGSKRVSGELRKRVRFTADGGTLSLIALHHFRISGPPSFSA